MSGYDTIYGRKVTDEREKNDIINSSNINPLIRISKTIYLYLSVEKDFTSIYI